jgi:SAM-dependent methyltransferase
MALEHYNVVIVQPPNFAVVPAVWEVGRLLNHSFQSLGAASTLQVNGLNPNSLNVLLGYQWLDDAAVTAQYPIIVYQLEQLSHREGWFTDKRLELLKQAREVWDYSPENIEFLRQHGVERVKLLPMGFHERLHTIPAAAQDIDVLFYGMVNERRKEVLNNLERRCRLAALVGVFGPERDAMIARSKIVLNLHFYDKCILEQTRVSYLLNNGCCVVSEDSASNPYTGMIVTAPRANVADVCLELLGDTPRREALRQAGFEKFRRLPMTDLLQQVLAESAATCGAGQEVAVRNVRGDSSGVITAMPGSEQRQHTANPMNLSRNSTNDDHERPEILALLQRQGIRPETVLELGCSAGSFGARLKQTLGVRQYVGVESSETAALQAALRLDRVALADLERTAPDDLGWPHAGFDLLVALDSLAHLVNPWDTLAAWADVLKPGGHAVLSMPNVQNVELLQGLAAGSWDYVGSGLLDVAHLRFFTKRSLEQLLTGAGLRIVQMESLLQPQLDMSQLGDAGNTLNFGHVTINNLTREQVIQLMTHHYLVLAQKTP